MKSANLLGSANKVGGFGDDVISSYSGQ